ncbi:glycosyltransferase family 1 protein [Pinirhizobacter sp.]|jgi:hypothetical protein|uniref:glycosyltransferase family 4 protein n=1 Tax=Pinirhizobacter sp. TaxID=2950432 RepID=UPI002F3E9DCD
MKLVIDLQACQSPDGRIRGVGRYCMSLARAMATDPRGHEVWLAVNGAMPESAVQIRDMFEDVIPRHRVVAWEGLAATASRFPENRVRSLVAEALREDFLESLAPDVVLTSSMIDGWVDSVVTSVSSESSALQAAIVFDLIPLVMPAAYLRQPGQEAWYREKLGHLSRCDVLLGISESTCDEVVGLMGIEPDRVVNISAAVGDEFVRLSNAAGHRHAGRKFGISRPFVMYAGGFDVRKNLARLIEAFARLPEGVRCGHQLVLVGNIDVIERDELTVVREAAGLDEDELVFTGFVSDQELVKLYNACALYIFPSEHEGFGLPALEAMSCGAVVMGANATSLPEVIGYASALFDPLDIDAIRAAMEKGLLDEGFRQAIRQHGANQTKRFSWRASASAAWGAIENALAHRPSQSGPQVVTLPSTQRLAVRDDETTARLLPNLRDKPLELVGSGLLPLVTTVLASESPALLSELTYRRDGYPLKPDAGHIEPALSVHDLRLASPRWSWVATEADQDPRRVRYEKLVNRLLDIPGIQTLPPADLKRVANAMASQTSTQGSMRSLYLDVSHLVIEDAKTGIQRVVRHIVAELLADPPPGFRVEPVYLQRDGVFRYARQWMQGRVQADFVLPPDELVIFQADDIFLGIDLTAHMVPYLTATFHAMRSVGVEVIFVVYDVLPLLRPDCFDPAGLPMFRSWYESIARIADGLICISRTVADELVAWLDQGHPERSRPLKIGWFHLGADLVANDSSIHAPSELPAPMQGRPTFLMVGTIEPRKGHAQALSAFELLWADGVEVNLVIIGKAGWHMDETIDRLRGHAEAGRHLHWLERADDATLVSMYHGATALLASSEGEGFGLPLIEAAQYGLPILARDLPIFREVAGSHASYFDGLSARELAAAVKQWLALESDGVAPPSAGMPWLSWYASSRQLLDVVINGKWPLSWRSGPRRRLAASDYMSDSSAGALVATARVSTGEPGQLYLSRAFPATAGHYRVVAKGRRDGADGIAWIDVLAHRESSNMASEPLDMVDGFSQTFEFELLEDVADLRVGIMVDAEVTLELSAIEVERLSLGDVSPKMPRSPNDLTHAMGS